MVLNALISTVAVAVASIFSAVPARVWSALKLMHATARRSDETIPTSAATTRVRITISPGGVVAGNKTIVIAPPIAPKTMIPSRPILITPERSENMPPRATKVKTAA